MTSRAAQLAIAAVDCLALERTGGFTPSVARAATRDILREVAQELGYRSDEWDSAIADAIATAAAEVTGA